MENFDKIEVGQWVWSVDHPRWGAPVNRIIHEVRRITKTLIICDDGDEFDRFKRSDGWNHNRYSRRNIVEIATPEDITSFGIPAKLDRENLKVRRAKYIEISAILPAGMTAWLTYQGDWECKIDLKGISEAQVRQLAVAVATAERCR